MISSTMTSQNKGEVLTGKRLQAAGLVYPLLRGGSSSLRGLLFPGAREHIHDPLEGPLTLGSAPMQSTQEVTITISVTGNILTFIDM